MGCCPASSTMLVVLMSLTVSVRSCPPMDSLPVHLSLLSEISQLLVSNPLIFACFRSAGMSSLLVRFSRPASSRSLSMDLRQDHIKTWHVYSNCWLTTYPSLMLYIRAISKGFQQIDLAWLTVYSFQMGHQHVCLCAPSLLGTVHNIIHFVVAWWTHS